jgi:hypothetical protein
MPPTKENLVQEVIEESSESDTATEPPTSPCKIKAIRLLGLFILLGFVLPGTIFPFVGLSTYLSAQSIPLEKELGSPSWVLYFLQILFIIAGGCAAFSEVQR